jgi:type III secretory pathway component EscT
MPGSVLAEVQRAFAGAGIDLTSLAFAWARALPIVVLVPAFGLRALPVAGRAVIALALAAVIAPGVSLAGGTHAVRLLEEATRGVGIAIAAAVPLWAATMVGGVVDALRASPERTRTPTVEGSASPLGIPLSLLASAIFFATGGASRVVTALARPETASNPVVLAAHDLVAGIALAVALGGPVLAASIVVEIGAALVARAASPAQVHTLLAPLRALAVLVVLAVGIDRIAEGLALAMR